MYGDSLCNCTRKFQINRLNDKRWEDRIEWRIANVVGKQDTKRMREYVKWNICHVRGRCIVRIRAWTTEISRGRS